MRSYILILIVMIFILLTFSGCDRTSKGIEAKESLEDDAPELGSNAMQTAVTGLMLEAGVSQLDASYNEVDTKEEVEKVTAGNGAFKLSSHLSTSYPITPAYDISQSGKVSVD